MGFIKNMFDSGRKEYKRCEKLARKVFALEPEIQKLTDDELKAKTPYFKELLKTGKTLDDILVEAYAVVREAAYRVTGMKPFFVQVAGAIAIHGGNIAEMKTGEGKTLTAVMPAYLNALAGLGVHIVTVNEYLAKRETDGPIGEIYRFLGLSVGLNLRDISREEKRQAYDCDILYSTNSELGFDYLRDHMVVFKEDIVQSRGLNFAIIDEVDSILIDEARTPLIISGGERNNANLYIQADTFAKRLADDDYEIDIETKTITLTPSGIEKAEKFFGVSNIYDIQYVSVVHHIQNALRANYIFHNGVEYLVQDGEVVIVDQFTGRVLKGRQYSEGLHQAIQAKENVEIKKETVTVATITYQNFFRMYKKLAGMTGTAKTEEEEFRDIYNMYVVEVPTNRPVIRQDMPDYLFIKAEDKFNALIEEIKERHAKGQPILVGTISVDVSEHVSSLLKKEGIKHEVLNAKNNEREAEIISHAGEKGSVTIATNMAGRGTDIKIDDEVRELGGLCVLGTERHESRRIDNQLRGRSGRQGDPGFTRFYISTEDDLLMRFGGDSFKNRLEWIIKMNADGDLTKPLESKMFTKVVTNAQERIEGNNFDTRKNVLKYDDVMRRQRELFYSERTEVITRDSIEDLALNMLHKAIEDVAYSHMKQVGNNKYDIDDDAICNAFNTEFFGGPVLSVDIIKTKDDNEIVEYIMAEATKRLYEKKDNFPKEVYEEFLKVVVLRVLDTFWQKHIDDMQALRQGVGLSAYAQENPLQIYQAEGFNKFETMMKNINKDVAKYLIRAQIRANDHREERSDLATNDSKGGEVKRDSIKNAMPKVGRNDPCPCGSGKKYKYCHGR